MHRGCRQAPGAHREAKHRGPWNPRPGDAGAGDGDRLGAGDHQPLAGPRLRARDHRRLPPGQLAPAAWLEPGRPAWRLADSRRSRPFSPQIEAWVPRDCAEAAPSTYQAGRCFDAGRHKERNTVERCSGKPRSSALSRPSTTSASSLPGHRRPGPDPDLPARSPPMIHATRPVPRTPAMGTVTKLCAATADSPGGCRACHRRCAPGGAGSVRYPSGTEARR